MNSIYNIWYNKKWIGFSSVFCPIKCTNMLRIVIVGAVIWISVTAWFVPWDFLVTDWIVFLIAGVILAIFYNNLRGIGVVARSKWSMIWWRTELHDVGGDQGGRLLHPSCPRRKESTLWWRCSRKEEWPRDDGVLGRMSDFRISRMIVWGDALLAHVVVCLREILMGWDMCRNPGAD